MQLAGLYNVLTVVLPAAHGRLGELAGLLPMAGVLTARAAAGAPRLLLIHLPRCRLRRGKRRTWQVAVVVAAAGVVLHLTQGWRVDAAAGAAVPVFGYWNVIEDGEVSNRMYDAGQRTVATAAAEDGNEAIRRAAAAAGATCVDTFTAFQGGAGTADPTGLLAVDGDHPNAAGHALLARLAHRVQPVA